MLYPDCVDSGILERHLSVSCCSFIGKSSDYIVTKVEAVVCCVLQSGMSQGRHVRVGA